MGLETSFETGTAFLGLGLLELGLGLKLKICSLGSGPILGLCSL